MGPPAGKSRKIQSSLGLCSLHWGELGLCQELRLTFFFFFNLTYLLSYNSLYNSPI